MARSRLNDTRGVYSHPTGLGSHGASLPNAASHRWAHARPGLPRRRENGRATLAYRAGTPPCGPLKGEVASHPGGAPFVAELLESACAGRLSLKRGTELHVSAVQGGGHDHRVYLRVQFARLQDQTVRKLSGWVRDGRGRPGLAGRRLVVRQGSNPQVSTWRTL